MKKTLILACLVTSSLFAEQGQVEVNLGIPSSVKGLVGVSYQPTESSFAYSFFYPAFSFDFDMGVGVSYYFKEQSSFYLLQSYQVRYANTKLENYENGVLVDIEKSGLGFGVYSGIGYKWQFAKNFSAYGDVAIPVYFTEHGVYGYRKKLYGTYVEDKISFQFGGGVGFNF